MLRPEYSTFRFWPVLLLLLALLAPLRALPQHRTRHTSRKTTVTHRPRKAAAHRVAPSKRPGRHVAQRPLVRPTARPAASLVAAHPVAKPMTASAQNQPVPFAAQLAQSRWVDSVMQTLTPDQRVAQLFMVAAYSNRARVDEDALATHVDEQARMSQMSDPHDVVLRAPAPPLPELLGEVGRSHTGHDEEVRRQCHPAEGKAGDAKRRADQPDEHSGLHVGLPCEGLRSHLR